MIEAADIHAARGRLAGTIYETPCPYSETLSALTGARVFVKLENLQMTGSFKERGAANLLLQLSPDERRRGVVAASAGNHGLAVAFHAARLGVSAVIVMPEWAPLAKVTAARRRGAEVVLHGDNFDEAYARAREIEAARDLVFVHPFDDPRVIAGQGTIGLELLEQVPGLDAVLVPVGGGGLLGGVALAVKTERPAVQVIGVQAQEVPGMASALAAGTRVTVPAATRTGWSRWPRRRSPTPSCCCSRSRRRWSRARARYPSPPWPIAGWPSRVGRWRWSSPAAISTST